MIDLIDPPKEGSPRGRLEREASPATSASGERLAEARIGQEITGFTTGDTIDLATVTATSKNYANGVLTLLNGAKTVASLAISGAASVDNFMLKSDNNGGTDITFVPTPNAVSALTLFRQYVAAGFESHAAAVDARLDYTPVETRHMDLVLQR